MSTVVAKQLPNLDETRQFNLLLVRVADMDLNGRLQFGMSQSFVVRYGSAGLKARERFRVELQSVACIA